MVTLTSHDITIETVTDFTETWTFVIENGNTGSFKIIDPLLDTQERAETRALSEFLQNSYALKKISFSTHLTNLQLNQCIRIEGLNFIIKSIITDINPVSMISRIEGVRYE